MKKIILNADDFGKTIDSNIAIDEAFSKNVIASAGLIVTGNYLQDAVARMEKGGYVEHVHIHFNVSSNPKNLGSDDAPITSKMQNDSLFCKDGLFKPYHRLPQNFRYIIKWKMVYDELVAQFDKFKEVTHGQGDYSHVDFHLWYNLTWPVSVALHFFLKRNHIKSARIIGVHQESRRKYNLYKYISSNRHLLTYPATNIDYYLSKIEEFELYDIIELYCHPVYKNGLFLDNSPSYLKHDRQPMMNQIQALKDIGITEYISWKDMANK